MPVLKLDFTNIPDNFIPAGEVDAVITKVVVREGKNAPYLNWEFDLVDPEHKGRKVWMMTSLSEKSLWRLRDVFKSLGLDAESVALDVEEDIVINPPLANVPVRLKLSVEEYEGTKRNRVDAILERYDLDEGGEGRADLL